MEILQAFKQENFSQYSVFLQREVVFDVYIPQGHFERNTLLLLNDGQDLAQLGYTGILQDYLLHSEGKGLWTVAIHANKNKVQEYGTASYMEAEGRGSKADLYTRFIIKELLPFLKHFFHRDWEHKAFAGFTFGGLSALDIVWNHPDIFDRAGVFSGMLGWSCNRDVANECRVMHRQVKKGAFRQHLAFFFEYPDNARANDLVSSHTLDLIKLMKEKGYKLREQLHLEKIKGGKDDYATWATAMPRFLNWLGGMG